MPTGVILIILGFFAYIAIGVTKQSISTKNAVAASKRKLAEVVAQDPFSVYEHDPERAMQIAEAHLVEPDTRSKALSFFETLASKGNLHALELLARIYQVGGISHPFYVSGAEQDHNWARVVERDLYKSMGYYKTAIARIEQGDTSLGKNADSLIRSHFQLNETLAENGDKDAKLWLIESEWTKLRDRLAKLAARSEEDINTVLAGRERLVVRDIQDLDGGSDRETHLKEEFAALFEQPVLVTDEGIRFLDGKWYEISWHPSYDSYLNSNLWKRLRAEVLRRDQGRCVACGEVAEHVHHKKYPDRWGRELSNDLVSVCRRCHDIHHKLAAKPEARPAKAMEGHIYEGKVVKLMDFGAFVSIPPGLDGLVHISQISHERIENVSDKLAEGDSVRVKVIEVDKNGRMRLSMKAVDG